MKRRIFFFQLVQSRRCHRKLNLKAKSFLHLVSLCFDSNASCSLLFFVCRVDHFASMSLSFEHNWQRLFNLRFSVSFPLMAYQQQNKFSAAQFQLEKRQPFFPVPCTTVGFFALWIVHIELQQKSVMWFVSRYGSNNKSIYIFYKFLVICRIYHVVNHWRQAFDWVVQKPSWKYLNCVEQFVTMFLTERKTKTRQNQVSVWARSATCC